MTTDGLRVVGLGSGTSADALDVAVGDFALVGEATAAPTGDVADTGVTIRLGPVGHREAPLPDELRSAVVGALTPATPDWVRIAEIDRGVGVLSAQAALEAVQTWDDRPVDLVVSHGQTLFHHVADGQVRATLQLGQPAWIAEATGLPVVSDLRVADVAAGGQGAPLASTLDALLLGGREQPTAALNLGGIGNVTIVRPGEPVLAFDTGPANALLDAAIAVTTLGAQRHDTGGAGAALGRVDPSLLRELLADPYYALAPPKSTGKEKFSMTYLHGVLARHGHEVSAHDVLATLTELTARTVAEALDPYAVREVVVSGGGVRNRTLMQRLTNHLPGVDLVPSSDLGIAEEAKEAYLFALLGFLTWHGLPGTIPSATGARRGPIAGRITPGRHPLQLPPPATSIPTRLVVTPPPRW